MVLGPILTYILYRSYYERPNSKGQNFKRPNYSKDRQTHKAENMAEKWVFQPFSLIWTIIRLFEWEKCSFALYFWKAENKIRPFELFCLLSFYENSTFIFLIFCLIFRPFEYFGHMVSAFYDFGLLSFGPSVPSPLISFILRFR